jgi:hypothetical protein
VIPSFDTTAAAPIDAARIDHTTIHQKPESFLVNTPDSMTIDPTIAAAAARVAQAEADLAQEQEAAGQVRAAADQVRGRIADLDARRAAIAHRRGDGDYRDGDGAELELMRLDREGLVEMQNEAEAMVSAATAKEDAAANVLALARDALSYAEDLTALGALARHSDQLVSLLDGSLGQMAAILKARGLFSYRWAPNEALLARLRATQIAGQPR